MLLTGTPTCQPRVLVVVAVVLCALAPTSAAQARRAPTKGEVSAITAALHKSTAIRHGLCFHVRNIVISTAGPWASAKVVRCDDGRRYDTALAVLQRCRGKWRVRDLGTSGVGCTVAPARVRRDLKLSCI
jgi:hypothetical protein